MLGVLLAAVTAHAQQITGTPGSPSATVTPYDDPKARADERPTHRVRVDGFWMDKTVVTNAQFRRFVEATGYVTVAERKPDWEELKKRFPQPFARYFAADSLQMQRHLFHDTNDGCSCRVDPCSSAENA